MFHDGDLQSGISRAIQEQKLVTCFVREDGNEESDVWESSYLASSSDAILSKCVLLKIDAGSQGANFLSAFCPVSRVPTLVVINNGQVLEKLEGGGMAQDEFTGRLYKALGVNTDEILQHDASQTEEAEDDTEIPQASTHSDTQPSSTPPSQEEPSNVQDLFPGRAARLESEHQKRQAAEKAERAARAKARRKEAEEAAATSSSTDDPHRVRATGEAAEKERARQSWLMQQKQRKDEARQERQRILDAIENDKQERKSRAAREKEQVAPSESLRTPNDAATASTSSSGATGCNLQIRLFDGSSLRHRFDATATLATDVRTWISTSSPFASSSAGAGTAEEETPYTFRLLRAPHASRGLEVGEEHRSLRDLGLCPTATLVLVPVRAYTRAYAAGGGGGGARGYVGAAYGLVSGLLSSVLAYVPGFGGEPGSGPTGAGAVGAEGTASGATTASAATRAESTGGSGVGSASAKVKVKTLADQRAEAGRDRRQAEFYNGNSSAFEGRKDGSNDDEDS